MNRSFLRLCLGAGLLLIAAYGVLAADVAATPSMMPVLNVKDFGAVGDGKADDTNAILQTMNMAGKPNPKKPGDTLPTTVFIPAGTYRITKTLTLNTSFYMNHLLGEGAIKQGQGGYTTLLWDGEAGKHMFDFQGYMALRLSEMRIDGNGKADVLLRINSVPGVGTGLWYYERLNLTNAGTGVELGADMDACASDMTFVDCNIDHMKVAGFHTRANQNVDYVFIRCCITNTPIGVYFEKGGVGHFILPSFGRVRTAFKIDQGGINGGVFTITGLQLETFNYDNEKRRFTILEAKGETSVTFTGIYTGCGQVWGPNGDRTPNFILGPSAQVAVRDSMISGCAAALTGTTDTSGDNAGSTWIQFENCRFRCASDPIKDIKTDDNSGFELRNCFVIRDNTLSETPADYYGNLKPLFIPSYVKYPKNTPIYKQEDANALVAKPVNNKPAPAKPVVNKPFPGKPKIN